MIEGANHNWTPNWATHPGEHLAEFIEARGWSQAEFARISDLTPKLVSTILTGKNPVMPDTAIKFERVLGVKAQVWLNLQANWDLCQARTELEKRSATAEAKAWLVQFPLKELRVRGRLPDTRDEGNVMEAMLGFLGIGAPSALDARIESLAVQHRQSKGHQTSPYYIYSWLRLGEEKALSFGLPPFDPGKFLDAVQEIRNLTILGPEIFVPKMCELCHRSGVALVFEKAMPKTCLYGSARWLDDDHAIIQMSLRMKTNDHFWWTFFHEAAHIILHRGKNFVDDEGGEGDGAENEADKWAEELLVGRDQFESFKLEIPNTVDQIKRFADEKGVHSGIIVGMLQHASLVRYNSPLNDLKERFEWSEDLKVRRVYSQ